MRHEMRSGHQPAVASAACACVAWLIVCIGCAAQRAAAPLPQAAPSSWKIFGQDLPVLATEPKDDVPFVAPSTSVLADKYRRSLFPTGGSANDLKLVKVHRDPAGQLFVYLPIRATKKDADGFTLELDNSGLPPWIEARRRYQSTPTRGLYQITTHDALGSDLMMTVEEAAKLDIVVRPCRVEKLVELECQAPGP